MVDKHVVKMILESAQLLSTAHRVLDGKEKYSMLINPTTFKVRKQKTYVLSTFALEAMLYRATHINHPSSVWTRESVDNYDWLYRHFIALGEEYTFRYGKQHASITKLAALLANPPKMINHDIKMTQMPSCMDTQYIVGYDPIENYRNYYIHGKSNLHRWTSRVPPSWMTGKIIETTENNKTIYTIER